MLLFFMQLTEKIARQTGSVTNGRDIPMDQESVQSDSEEDDPEGETQSDIPEIIPIHARQSKPPSK